MQPPDGPVLASVRGLRFLSSTGPGLLPSCLEQTSPGWQVPAARQPLGQAGTNLVMGAMLGDIYRTPRGSRHRTLARRGGGGSPGAAAGPPRPVSVLGSLRPTRYLTLPSAQPRPSPSRCRGREAAFSLNTVAWPLRWAGTWNSLGWK